jgi:hypothetical protein
MSKHKPPDYVKEAAEEAIKKVAGLGKVNRLMAIRRLQDYLASQARVASIKDDILHILPGALTPGTFYLLPYKGTLYAVRMNTKDNIEIYEAVTPN